MEKFNRRKLKYLKFAGAVSGFLFHQKKLKKMPDIKKAEEILIVESGLIGDCVMLSSFLAIIRKNNNDARITLVCAKWGKVLLETQNLVDRYVIIDLKIIESPVVALRNFRTIRKYYKEINSREYDIAIETKGDSRYILFMRFCCARRMVSYNYSGGEGLLTDVLIPDDNDKHLVEDRIHMARSLGCIYSKEDMYPKLKLSSLQIASNDEFVDGQNLKNKLIIGIHPGASQEHKRWKKYARLIKEIEIPDAVYLIFAGPKEGELAYEVKKAGEGSQKKCIIVNKEFEIYIRMIAVCNLCICNDSGAGHMAAAYGIPTVVIMGPFESSFALPYAKNSIAIEHQLNCKPCMSNVCLTGDNACIDSISVEEVKEKVYRALEDR